jgi:HAD superfamily hydrolase (TIGR01549 family)
MNQKDPVQNAVLFDLEDTLVKTPWTDRVHVLEFRRATRSKLVELGIPETLLAQIERATIMRNMAEDYINANFSRTRRAQYHEEMERFLVEYEMESAKKSILFLDTIPTLEALRKDQAKIGLVTNTSRRAVNHVFQKDNLARFFDCVVTRDDVEKLKPDPEGIRLSIRILNTESFFMIGDLFIDVYAAKNAGGTAVLLKREKDQNHRSESIMINYNESLQKADYTINSLREVPEIIQTHKGKKKMIRVEKICKKNIDHVLEELRQDPVRHVFADYDLRYDPAHTEAYAVFSAEVLDGYILTYTAADVPSVILESDHAETAQQLIQHAPQSNFIVHALPNLLSVIASRHPSAKYYYENWMLVKKGKANIFTSHLVRKLQTKQDALQLSRLLETRKERPKRTVEKYVDWLRKMKMYGVFVQGKLVSYSGSFLQTPQISMIGGVYTHPELRNRGYSTLATSAITEEALKNSEAAALFVRSDNYPAIRVYEKIGYRKIGRKIWVDVGTGLRP